MPSGCATLWGERSELLGRQAVNKTKSFFHREMKLFTHDQMRALLESRAIRVIPWPRRAWITLHAVGTQLRWRLMPRYARRCRARFLREIGWMRRKSVRQALARTHVRVS
jgi:hypothetical protein